MRRKKWIVLAALPVLLLAGDIFYWRLAIRQLRTEFEAWARNARAAGWTVAHGTIGAAGWPDAAVLRIDDLSVVTPATQEFAAIGWGTDTLLLRTRLTQPYVLELTPVGPRPLRLSHGPPIPVSADHLHVRVAFGLNVPPRSVDLDAVTLAVAVPGLGWLHAGHLTAHADFLPGAGRDQAAVTFSASVRPLTLPAGKHWGLGPEVTEAALEGVLNGPLPLGAGGGQGLSARATSWRDDGGSLELHKLAIVWGQTKLDATATLALDEDLQPMGAGSGKISGYGPALDALAANAVLSRSAAKAAKAVLALLANTPADGQPEAVEVPLTLQFRTLSVRQVPLARLPVLVWPKP